MPEFDATVEYRDIPGFPGYKVGNDGTVWSCVIKGSKKSRLGDQWRQLRITKQGGGYGKVYLGRRKNKWVHRLVLEAFVGMRPDGMECCHNDGDPTNNHVSNLRWGTPKENNGDKVMHGTHIFGENQNGAKLTEWQVRNLRAWYAAGGLTFKQLADQFGVSETAARLIVRQQRWRHVS